MLREEGTFFVGFDNRSCGLAVNIQQDLVHSTFQGRVLDPNFYIVCLGRGRWRFIGLDVIVDDDRVRWSEEVVDKFRQLLESDGLGLEDLGQRNEEAFERKSKGENLTILSLSSNRMIRLSTLSCRLLILM